MIDEPEDGAALEYTLSLLDPEERRAFEAALLDDPELAARVWTWEDRLVPLAEALRPRPMPKRALARIEGRIFGEGGRRRRATDRAVAVWRRAFALASLVAAAALIGFVVLLAKPELLAPQHPQWVAAIIYEDGAVTLARLREDGTLVATSAAPLTAAGSQELWLVPEGGTPISLGLMPEGESGQMPLGPQIDRQFSAGGELRITLEPQGGSPTGEPTGPLVAAGPLYSI
ncbi:anti-sigma factor [Acuticoccus sp. M5D2P5]|uniref:anti-sigma factor n=1 Tax=Acuticoccus kalidii TaxID=2910977 RepID=UPI001F2FCCB5|nr:anti-sigma factor [Acuticoccus kalidii]MCF3935429.1 anti-sigma factor [Acuticoccus kalidii]